MNQGSFQQISSSIRNFYPRLKLTNKEKEEMENESQQKVIKGFQGTRAPWAGGPSLNVPEGLKLPQQQVQQIKEERPQAPQLTRADQVRKITQERNVLENINRQREQLKTEPQERLSLQGTQPIIDERINIKQEEQEVKQEREILFDSIAKTLFGEINLARIDKRAEATENAAQTILNRYKYSSNPNLGLKGNLLSVLENGAYYGLTRNASIDKDPNIPRILGERISYRDMNWQDLKKIIPALRGKEDGENLILTIERVAKDLLTGNLKTAKDLKGATMIGNEIQDDPKYTKLLKEKMIFVHDDGYHQYYINPFDFNPEQEPEEFIPYDEPSINVFYEEGKLPDPVLIGNQEEESDKFLRTIAAGFNPKIKTEDSGFWNPIPDKVRIRDVVRESGLLTKNLLTKPIQTIKGLTTPQERPETNNERQFTFGQSDGTGIEENLESIKGLKQAVPQYIGERIGDLSPQKYEDARVVTQKEAERYTPWFVRSKEPEINITQLQPEEVINLYQTRMERQSEEMNQFIGQKIQEKPKETFLSMAGSLIDKFVDILPFTEDKKSKTLKRELENIYPLADSFKVFMKDIRIKDVSPLIEPALGLIKSHKDDSIYGTDAGGFYRGMTDQTLTKVVDGLTGGVLPFDKLIDVTQILKKEKIYTSNLEPRTSMHELLHSMFDHLVWKEESAETLDAFMTEWDQTKERINIKEEENPLEFIDQILETNNLYKDNDRYGIATERYAFLGDMLGEGGLKMFPEELRKYYKIVFR